MGTIPSGITILDRMNGPVDRKRKRERRQIQDLNLPVDEHDSQKSPRAEASTYPANTIILEDDEDDDVQVCSPQSIARARLATSSTFRRQRPHHRPVSLEDSLQLGLQLGHSSNPTTRELMQGHERPVPQFSWSSPADASEDCIVLGSNVQPQKKVQREPEPVKLTCAICLDTMKEEMSTVCGHVFCRECILGAIRAQKRCPTCRRKLSAKEVHRIYL